MCWWRKEHKICSECNAILEDSGIIKFVCQRAMDYRPLADPLTKFGTCGNISPGIYVEEQKQPPCAFCVEKKWRDGGKGKETA